MKIKYSIDDLDYVAQQLIDNSTFKTWLFNAPMGAGKTTLIKALAKNLGVKNIANSPTFSIVNEYLGKQGKIYHFDLYRLQNEEEAYDMGLDEYFYENAWCFVEWPKVASNILPENTHQITIEIIDEDTRELNFE
ncbi:tRNA (adenosine(37)-N6)-threonylcarbamoyltransferase complex ATPase subunit type 1 TsaE [Flavobacterium dauae]|uniref:tRNA (adenosine(37)-N6)-threonylcarbamoyltransferase complex ATPase subunit type 1 TsaE n=1 Tax=Flavobacterium dauae TaxID=1563479 RepID=UPI00101B2674|nr:tRNA (adenosine(37)-N6)-threonylcarbamoyltransferase complex ATPase subunit type 1 TsaE [Flavobacterium dauae]WLD25085.1 tRNA (adenosine(37)-N6)-threonylcarbamoyltransferase complex ATPase subunit type 1 TsaE [Flavobacterium dauae]